MQQKIARININTELQQKHREKRKLKREIIQLLMKLKAHAGFVLFNGVTGELYIVLKNLSKRHEKKFGKLGKIKVDIR